jgi:hypothetical protein
MVGCGDVSFWRYNHQLDLRGNDQMTVMRGPAAGWFAECSFCTPTS